MVDRRFFIGLAALACALAMSSPAGSTPAVASAATSIRTALTSVSCSSPTSCFAVGSSAPLRSSTSKTLTERWNGTAWSIVPSPNSNGAIGNQLESVACTSPTNCLAVGYAATNPSFSHTHVLIERWNGKSWSIVNSPNPTGGTYREFAGIACTSSTNCFAVGVSFATSTSGSGGSLIERWDGKSWSIMKSPATPLSSVSCANPTSCFAVGQSSSARWNGKAWSSVPTPQPRDPSFEGYGLNSVSCRSASACLVVGADAVPLADFSPLSERWNGKVWSSVAPIPYPSGDAYLNGVSCTSTTSCVAVGAYDDSSFGVGPLARAFVDQWNGTAWSQVASPSFGKANSWLASVSCTSATNCFAAGYLDLLLAGGRKALIEHWDGTTWSTVVPAPAGNSRRR